MVVRAIHPGEHLAEELDEPGMSAAAVARQISVPTNRVTAILNGRWAVTGDTALRLARKKAGKSILTLPTLKTPATASMHQKGRRRARGHATVVSEASATPPL